jgi:integrase
VTKAFKRRRDADAYAATTQVNKLRGVVIDPRRGRITVREFADHWLTGRTDLAERTRELYRYLLDKHVFPTLGTTTLGSLSPSDVRKWHQGIADAHPTTAAKAYRLLSTIMKTAVSDEMVARNPCQVKGAASEKAPERPTASMAEVQALADAMPENMRVAVLLASWCQLRRAELLGLRRRDVDTLHGTVSVVVTRTKTMAGTMVDKAPRSCSHPRRSMSWLRYWLMYAITPRWRDGPTPVVLRWDSRLKLSLGLFPVDDRPKMTNRGSSSGKTQKG